MLDNEITTGQTSEVDVASQTAENPDSSQKTAEVNDAAFESAETKTEASNDVDAEKSEITEEKSKQTKQNNAENARRRREAERQRELTAMRNKTILDVLGGINPFTKEEMKDDADVEEYLEMKDMQSKGMDPVSDYSRYKKQKERERQQAADEERQQKEWYAQDAADFAKKYPDVKLDDIVKSESFQSFAAGKVGKVPISEIYGEFLRTKEVFIEEYKNQTAQEYAKKQASPGALGGGTATEKSFFTKEEVDKMSRSEIRKNLTKIEESMKKWK